MPYQPIENHGVVGDLCTVALVGVDGTIDFLSWPLFDSPTIFASLLDDERGGSFKLAPVLDDSRVRQMYLPDTNVLFTRFKSAEGVAEVNDFMPIEDGQTTHELVRRAKTVRGEVRFRLVVDPRFDYGRAGHRAYRDSLGVVFESTGAQPVAVRLRASVPVTIDDGRVTAEFILRAGEQADFILEEALPGAAVPRGDDYVDAALHRTVHFWRSWVARGNYTGRWREAVNRSALTLKLLTSRDHGSMVAAPTFGLPEEIGGVRNWDYRYTWIRDAAFSLSSLMRIGHTDEAAAFMNWLESRCEELAPDGSLQVMYGIDGRHQLPESVLTHFDGFMHSKPVRVGNAAVDQLQLDIYGELMDAIHHHDLYGAPTSFDAWRNIRKMMDYVCNHWRLADEGIWEVRGGRQEFLISRVMCWSALDRAIRIAQRRAYPAPLDLWHRTRDEIHDDILAGFWNDERKAFVQARGGRAMDASVLLLPLMNFISPRDPKWLSTLAAVEEELVEDALVYRYRTNAAAPDGLTGEEGTFCMCTFWYVDCLAKAGRVEQARFVFEKALGYANHLGLFPEELGPRGEHLGNFPQAFTHLALIRAARMLDRALSAAGHDE
ncbi:MAG: glycoside hydrolase family 15 protein [Polyangiales bacterium]